MSSVAQPMLSKSISRSYVVIVDLRGIVVIPRITTEITTQHNNHNIISKYSCCDWCCNWGYIIPPLQQHITTTEVLLEVLKEYEKES